MSFLFYKNSLVVAFHGEGASVGAYNVREGRGAATLDTSDESQVVARVMDVWKVAFEEGG